MRIGRAYGVTDTGRRRRRNEDAFICEPPFFAVADGMGGARAGDVAADLAASALEEAGPDTRGADGVKELIVEANRRIFERSLNDPATAGMGAVVTVALVGPEGEHVVFGHVGDSRAYLLRDGDIEQVTTDHSLVAELVESGVLTPAEAERHPQRSAITRALGTESSVEIDAFSVETRPGDLFLICSDGLTDMVSDEEMARLVESAGRDPVRAAEALVRAANAGGGQDNVTVVLFELVDSAAETESAVDDADREPTASSVDDTQESAARPDAEKDEVELSAGESPTRHGAGPGGRAAALLLILGVLALGALAVYLALLR